MDIIETYREQDNFMTLAKGILFLVAIIIIFIILGKAFNWFYWWGSFIYYMKWVFIILSLLILIAIVFFLAYFLTNYKKIKNKRNKRKEEEKKKKEEEKKKTIQQARERNIHNKREAKKKQQQEIKEKKETELRTNILVKKILKRDKEYLAEANKQEKDYLKNKLRRKIKELIEAKNDDNDILDYLLGDKSVSVRKHKVDAGGVSDKYIEILDTIDKKYEENRIVRDEREFEHGLYNFLKAKFPEYDVKFQYPTERGGKVDIVIDDEIALELKVADSKSNLNDVFSKIHWYSKEFDKLAIIILDVGVIDDLDRYVAEFEGKGAQVVTIKGRLSSTRLNRRY